MAEIVESVSLPTAVKPGVVVSTVALTDSDYPDGLYPTIPGFRGKQSPRSRDGEEAKEYDIASKLYATSSHQKDHDMYPGLVIAPLDDQDVITAIKYAKDKKLKMSIKSGGHQYSGACSTSGPNIMMDLGKTYSQDLSTYTEGNNAMVRTSVSQPLADLNKFLCENQLFVPHGQCSTVHIGGHAQTGGYGNLARGFGLFGDHVRKIELFDHSANPKTISRDSPDEDDRRLFNAILGGSPGNFGVITHYHVQVYRDSDYMFGDVRPEFFWGFFWYTKDTLQRCLDKVAEMADNPDFDRNYDLCISVLSSSKRLFKYGPDNALDDRNPLVKVMDASPPTDDAYADGPENANEICSLDELKALNARMMEGAGAKNPWIPLPVIAIYAQWVPFSKDDKYDPKWFDDLVNAAHMTHRVPTKFLRASGPMSEITKHWLFGGSREFDHPYDKRTYLTTSTSLGQDGWVNKACDQIDMVVNRKSSHRELWNSCFLAVQIQCFGGNKSKFTTNKDNGTSYSWRDSTVVQVLDCFYANDRKDLAEGWQAENDSIMKGKGSCFGEQDRRVLWGSYGDWDMKNSWEYYYEDETKYKSLGEVRGIADPDGTFTPNPFAVEAILSQRSNA